MEGPEKLRVLKAKRSAWRNETSEDPYGISLKRRSKMTSALTRRDFMKLAGAGVAGAAFLGACGGQSASGLQQVKVGMSAFQDVSTLYVAT